MEEQASIYSRVQRTRSANTLVPPHLSPSVLPTVKPSAQVERHVVIRPSLHVWIRNISIQMFNLKKCDSQTIAIYSNISHLPVKQFLHRCPRIV